MMKTVEQILDTAYAEDISKDRRSIARFGRLCRKDLYPLIFINQSWTLWNVLCSTISMSTGEISKQTGIPSKNVSSQLGRMAKTGLVRFDRVGKLKKWHKID